jgi:conserved oligomeric Golgi complex subunit 2
VDRIKSTLSSDLDHLFSTTVRALAGGKEDGLVAKVPDGDKARLTSDMLDCLRTYDALGLWRDAEDVLRRDVLRDFIKKARRAC